MSTKRSANKIVERSGIRYVQNVIENTNCIFQEISHINDQGNDCYIEFISDNVATSFCIFAQIKSGNSYKDAKGYKIQADQDHVEYWHKHLLPVAGIVYDEELNKAFWINVSAYIKSNPEILNKNSHTIHISEECEFSFEKFDDFKNHFIEYINEYKSFENFGRSLDHFSKVDSPTLCYEGLKSLFSNHRDKKSAWHYIVSNFGKISERGIHRNILGMLSNFADNPHTFWHKDNIQYYPTEEIQNYLSQILTRYFRQNEVRIALSFMGRMVARGDFSFLVFLVLDFIQDVDNILFAITYDNNINEEDRNFAFWLYIHFAQRISVDKTLMQIDEFLKSFPSNDEDDLFIGMRDTIKDEGFVPIG
jgi:hypothetical protein